MRKAGSFILISSKILAFIIRLLLSLRYRVKVHGAEIVRRDVPVLFLPNHQALIDPIILLSRIYRFSTATPVISEKYYDIPIARWYFRKIGAVRVSDLEKGSRDTRVLQSITRSVLKGFRRNVNIVIYPGGQIAAQGYERIINKKSAYHIVKALPPEVQVVGVRINGLWGSMFSKARTGKSPDFVIQMLKGVLLVLANLVFFLPRRKVSIEIEDITQRSKEYVLPGLKEFNARLEEFYNLHGEEALSSVSYFFF